MKFCLECIELIFLLPFSDIHSPKIVCPNNVSLMVADWGARSTIFHFDTHEPYVTDNSGSVSYVVKGVPESKNFPIGYTELIYEAVDAAGNKASCIRYIHIRGLNKLFLISAYAFLAAG